MKTDHKNNRAYTLIEMLVALSIFSVVLLAALGLFKMLLEVPLLDSQKTLLHSKLERLVRETRRSRKVLSVGPKQLLLWREDLNRNFTPEANETIMYQLDDKTLFREGAPLIHRISEFELKWNARPPELQHLVIKLTRQNATAITGVYVE